MKVVETTPIPDNTARMITPIPTLRTRAFPSKDDAFESGSGIVEKSRR